MGVFFVVGLLVFIWGVNYLKGIDVLARQLRFHVVYEEVDGLLESNPVSLNGVKIGQVDRIAFHPDGSGRVVVTAIVRQHIPIPANSRAQLSGDIIGEKEIRIIMGDAPHGISPGDTLAGSVQPGLAEEISRQIIPFRDRAEQLMIQADSLLTALNIVLGPENRVKLESSIDRFSQTMASIDHTARQTELFISEESDRLGAILANIESITRNLEDNKDVLNHILQNMSDISDLFAGDQFAQTMEQVGESVSSMNRVMHAIESGEGSAALLLNDDSLYIQLRDASGQLEHLLEDIRKNPKNYFRISVFGR